MTEMVTRPWGPSWAWTGAPAQVTERAWNASEVDYWAEPLQEGGDGNSWESCSDNLDPTEHRLWLDLRVTGISPDAP